MKTHDLFYAYKPRWEGVFALCWVRIYRNDGRATVLIADLPNSPGASVTSAAQLIASGLVDRFSLDPATTRWIQYNKRYVLNSLLDMTPVVYVEMRYGWRGRSPVDVVRRDRIEFEDVERLIGESPEREPKHENI